MSPTPIAYPPAVHEYDGRPEPAQKVVTTDVQPSAGPNMSTNVGSHTDLIESRAAAAAAAALPASVTYAPLAAAAASVVKDSFRGKKMNGLWRQRERSSDAREDDDLEARKAQVDFYFFFYRVFSSFAL
ncbi:hypothetical protein B0F90DRAFT_1669338 [Multifurca ochricompacta]|uniref:Uncharacterized protein n=1 Tax=Multifurca ochricompacta TaxID=376703 RepID=A0AAD4QJE0_9AGAM|nr:hypothetical protein B0F90DRAFT_1669338 [Multifurca ochricompacta]